MRLSSRFPGEAVTLLDEMPMDTPPDRLCTEPRSMFYDEAVLARGIGVRFNGEDRTNVVEYCVSEGWVRLAVGRALDRRGNAITMKHKGVVEPYFRDVEAPEK
jgi:Protein of unknown function (DUF3297)